MTVSEAMERTLGHGPGLLQRGAVRYAQSLLTDGETVAAAVAAEISASVTVGGAVRREKFPGVAVLTDLRAIAVCALPGIRRSVLVNRGACVESPSAIRYTAAFSDGNNSFSLSLNPEDGERFARCVAVLEGRGEAFDAVDGEQDGGIWNPVLVRNRRRAKLAREKRVKERAEQKSRFWHDSSDETSLRETEDEDTKAAAVRLAAELEAARKQGQVSDTDPKAVAARLAAELAAEESDGDSK